MDSQTRVEHTLGDRRADPGDGQGAGRALRGGQAAVALPLRDARREQVARRAPRARRRAGGPARHADRVPRRRAGAAADATGCGRTPRSSARGDDFDCLEDILDNGNGAARQALVYEANHDLREVVREIVDASVPEAARDARRLSRWHGRRVLWRAVSQPDLFVVCKNCGSEVSPYVTECPYCGQRVRKRAPKLDRSGGEPQPKRRAAGPTLPRLRAEEIAGIAPDTRPYATLGLLLLCLLSLLVFRGRRRCSTSATWSSRSPSEVWRCFAAPFLSRRPARLRVRRPGRRGHLRHAARAPLRPRCRWLPCSCCRGAAGHGAGGLRSRRRRCSTNDEFFLAFGANGAALGTAVRLARRRPPGGAPRRGARQRPARRLRDRDRAGAALAGRGGGQHRRRRGRRARPARCSGSRCRCSRARARTDGLLVSAPCSRTSRWRRPSGRSPIRSASRAPSARWSRARAPASARPGARARGGRLVRRGPPLAGAVRRWRSPTRPARGADRDAARRGDPDGDARRRGGRLGARP